ncbi:basic 7S globulin-like [Papaver somniferum]|uniref:basic 7S globulin-like n=1 Tax=Papaver somniferum TaxID=3469 RepID=UPI000E700934|nr:basic 7S globulin-like [Papaver somniferum]
MASYFSLSVIRFLLPFFLISQLPSSSSRGIVFQLERDSSTLQYMIRINQGTPLTAVKLVVDLGGTLPWILCHRGAYNSSSIRPVKCTSQLCSTASKPVNSTCIFKNDCSIYTNNPVTNSVVRGELVSDLVNVLSNEDSNVTLGTPFASLRRCAFGCATTVNISGGLANGANGVAGLGRSSALSFVTQFAVGFRFSRIFALDLHDNIQDDKLNQTRGKIYFGGGPYIHYLYGYEDWADRVLTYTPLLINPKSKEEYFIDVKSIKVHGDTVPINKKLLSINKKTGMGGTKIDIQIPYTTLQTSIYEAFIKAYTRWVERYNSANAKVRDSTPNITMVTPVAPFTACYNSSTMPLVTEFNSVPPGVAFIFHHSVWNISLYDLVRVKKGVDCVGFVDGGSKPKTSIVIGARQIGFLEFDISRSRLGFEQPNIIDYEVCYWCPPDGRPIEPPNIKD